MSSTSSNSTIPPNSEFPVRNVIPYRFIRRYYALALLGLILLALFNYLTLRDLANTQESSAITINVSGRQRMLSQQIALDSLQLATSDNDSERIRLKDDLLNAINQMGVAHILLAQPDPTQATYLPLSPALHTIYFDERIGLDAQVKDYLALAAEIAAMPDDQLTVTNQTLVSLLADAPVILNSLNDAVSRYQIESDAKVDGIKQLTLGFFVLTLVVLILETLLIFRPMWERLRTEMKQLQTEINMRRQLEEILRQSRARYQDVIDEQTEAVCRYLSDGTLTFVNDSYCKLFNKPREQLVGQSLFDLITNEATTQHIRSVITNRRAETFQHQMTGSDGTTLWVEWVDGPVIDDDGHVIEFQAVGRDRTDVQRVETALHESEHRYRLLVQNLPDVAVLMFDHDLRYTLADGPFLERAGYNKEIMVGHTLDEIGATPETINYVKPMFRAALEGQETEYERERLDLTYHAKIVPVRDQDDTIIGGMIVTEDITKRKQAEEALQESEELLRQLTERIPQAFWMIETDTGNIIYISPAYETIWGQTTQSLYDDPVSFMSSIHPDDLDEVHLQRRENLANGTYDIEYRILQPDHSVRWVASRAYPISNKEGKVIRIAGLSEDVTERKAMEKQALEFAIDKENARLLANFIRDTSHDLRTPLTVINTGLYLLRKITDPQQRAERIDGIEAQIQRMNHLIDDLLKMSDLDSLTHLDTVSTDINQVVQEMHGAYSEQMANKHLEFTVSQQPDLPSIQADTDQIRRALAHLLENAIRFTPEGGKIAMSTALEGDEIVISLQDTGVGIDAEHLQHIFERFYKVDQARTLGSGGAGLGLAMVRKIAELHGGSVEVESSLGEGSTFRLKIPVDREAIYF